MSTYTRQFMQYLVEVDVDDQGGTDCCITDRNTNAHASLAAVQHTGVLTDADDNEFPISLYVLDLIETWATMVGY